MLPADKMPQSMIDPTKQRHALRGKKLCRRVDEDQCEEEIAPYPHELQHGCGR